MLGILFWCRAGLLPDPETRGEEAMLRRIRMPNRLFLGLIALSAAIFIGALMVRSYAFAGPFAVTTGVLIVLRALILERMMK